MTGQNERSSFLSRADLEALARTRAATAVDEIVSGTGDRTNTLLRSTALTRPGTNGVQPEPIAALETAHELERAAHDLVKHYIRLARQAGRSWSGIGYALDLHWTAVVSDESIADVAYSYAVEHQPSSGRRTFSWICPACQRQVSDKGPWPDPPEQEDGHAADCARRTSELDAWRQRAAPGEE
jgi:hypothetical protein